MALIKCRECGKQVSASAKTCPACRATPKKQYGCGCLALILLTLLIIGMVAGPRNQNTSTSKNGGSESSVPTAAPQPAAPKRPSPQQANLSVQNLVVKRVPVEGFLGKSTKFRYFFATKNNGSAPFVGNINITLHTKSKGITNKDFQCNIPPGIQGWNYFDAHTGPERFHADAAYVGFSYVATVDSAVVAQGQGAITTKFEELSQ